MTTITAGNALGDLGSSYQLNQATKKDNKTLGQEQFLQLMLTQFRNQDPLKPQDPTEFLTQLAQVSSVSGIAEMNQSLATLADSLYAGQALQAASVVGRDVLAPSDSTRLTPGQPVHGAVDLPVATAGGFVRVFDASGVLVKEIPLGTQAAGLARFTWDGTNNARQAVAAGAYKFVAGYGVNGHETALDTFLAKRVASVSLGGDGKRTEITTDDNQQIGLADIRAIF